MRATMLSSSVAIQLDAPIFKFSSNHRSTAKRRKISLGSVLGTLSMIITIIHNLCYCNLENFCDNSGSTENRVMSSYKLMNVADLLKGYDQSNLTIGVLGGHSALDCCHGAKKERLKTVCVARKGREKTDRKSTRLNSSHMSISYAFFCFKKNISPISHGAGVLCAALAAPALYSPSHS